MAIGGNRIRFQMNAQASLSMRLVTKGQVSLADGVSVFVYLHGRTVYM